MKANLILATLLTLPAASSGAVFITTIVDPDVNFSGRAIEIYVSGTEDLGNYDLQRAANTAAFDETFTLPNLSYTDQFVYLVRDDAAFDGVFGAGVGPTIALGALTGTGNDGFRLVDTGTNDVVDVVGEGGTNNYNDSFLSRMNGTGPDTAWTAANWTIPGNGTLDGLTGAQTAAAVPFGSFTPPAVPEPSSALLGSFALLGLIRRRR